MAGRPRKQLATVDNEGEIIDPANPALSSGLEVFDSSDGPADIALETALMQVGQESETTARVIIYRVVKENGKPVEEWLHETNPTDFAEGGLAWIGREWGAGTYRIRIFVPGEQGFRSNKLLRIAAPKDNAPQAAQSAGMGELTSVMMQGFQKLGELIVAGQQKPIATEEDMLRKMAMYKELFAPAHQALPASNPLDNMTTMMEMFKQGMELGRMGGGEPSSMDALMKGLEVLGPVVQQVAAQKATPAQQPMPPTQLQMQQPALPQTTQEETPVDIRAMMLQQALSFLVKQAKSNADPNTYANVVMDQLDENELSALVNRADWLDWLAGVNPEVKTPGIAEWFVSLRAEIIAYLTEPAEESISSGHATIEPEIPASPATISAADNPSR